MVKEKGFDDNWRGLRRTGQIVRTEDISFEDHNPKNTANVSI